MQKDGRNWGSWTLGWLQPNLLTSGFSKELLTRDPLGAADASLHSCILHGSDLIFKLLKSELWYHCPLEGAQYYLELLVTFFTVGF